MGFDFFFFPDGFGSPDLLCVRERRQRIQFVEVNYWAGINGRRLRFTLQPPLDVLLDEILHLFQPMGFEESAQPTLMRNVLLSPGLACVTGVRISPRVRAKAKGFPGRICRFLGWDVFVGNVRCGRELRASAEPQQPCGEDGGDCAEALFRRGREVGR
jgi:hypothetical protein